MEPNQFYSHKSVNLVSNFAYNFDEPKTNFNQIKTKNTQ